MGEKAQRSGPIKSATVYPLHAALTWKMSEDFCQRDLFSVWDPKCFIQGILKCTYTKNSLLFSPDIKAFFERKREPRPAQEILCKLPLCIKL